MESSPANENNAQESLTRLEAEVEEVINDAAWDAFITQPSADWTGAFVAKRSELLSYKSKAEASNAVALVERINKRIHDLDDEQEQRLEIAQEKHDNNSSK